MARFVCADWIGPTVNEGDGDGVPLETADAMGTVVWDVLHIQEGTEAGTEAWQRNPASQVSSHFLLPKVGRRPRQMVDTHDRSWCQVAGNRGGISMECEGHSGDALTADQIEQAAQIVAESHRVHGVVLQVCNNSTATTQAAGGLIYHAAGGTAWGGHIDCPGDPIIAQRPAILARAQQILNGDDDMQDITDPTAPNGTMLAFRGSNFALMVPKSTVPAGLGVPAGTVVEHKGVQAILDIQTAIAAGFAADATRDAAQLAAIQSLAVATGADPQPIIDAINAVRDEARTNYAALHQENADLKAQIAAYEAKEAQAAQAAAAALQS